MDSTIDDNESIDVDVTEEHFPKEDKDLLIRYHDNELIGGPGKYWIYVMTKRDRDMNWLISKIESYGLADDVDMKRAYIRDWRKHLFVIRSNSLNYMVGLCPYLKNVIEERAVFVLKHYIY